MIRLTALLAACLWATAVFAETPARVLLFGTFHFKDAGKDLVKVEDVDIFSAENQATLEALTDRMAAFKPTAVLLEYNPENEDEINQQYREYLAGSFELPANEIYQLGFRLAKKAGLERVHSFDHRDLHWAGRPMMEEAKATAPERMAAMEQVIADVTRDETEARASLPLLQLLARANDPARDALNMGFYVSTNDIGVDGSWSGADATATWWQRNYRMYARIQSHAGPGARVVAIGGQGHTAILKQVLAIDPQREAESVEDYLGLE